MSFDAGILTVYGSINVSADGNMPKKGLSQKFRAYYRYVTVGVQRYYTALQNAQRVDAVVEIPNYCNAFTDDVCELEDGYKYRILQSQYVRDKGVELTRMSLERMNEEYE